MYYYQLMSRQLAIIDRPVGRVLVVNVDLPRAFIVIDYYILLTFFNDACKVNCNEFDDENKT